MKLDLPLSDAFEINPVVPSADLLESVKQRLQIYYCQTYQFFCCLSAAATAAAAAAALLSRKRVPELEDDCVGFANTIAECEMHAPPV